MFYFEYKPANHLRKYVKKIWYCEADNHNFRCLSAPIINHELIINFSEQYNFQAVGNRNNYLNPKSWISGIQSKPINIASKGKHIMLGVLFKVHGLKAFLKYQSKDFEQQFIDPSLVFGAGYSHLLEWLERDKSVQLRINHLEAFLYNNLIDVEMPMYLKNCLRFFSVENDEMITVKNACIKFSISNKSLISSFNKYVGTTPLKFLNLIRVHRAMKNICSDPGQALTTLAYKLNYADQAHFTHSFKSIVGLTPSEYSRAFSNSGIEKNSPSYIFQPG